MAINTTLGGAQTNFAGTGNAFDPNVNPVAYARTTGRQAIQQARATGGNVQQARMQQQQAIQAARAARAGMTPQQRQGAQAGLMAGRAVQQGLVPRTPPPAPAAAPVMQQQPAPAPARPPGNGNGMGNNGAPPPAGSNGNGQNVAPPPAGNGGGQGGPGGNHQGGGNNGGGTVVPPAGGNNGNGQVQGAPQTAPATPPAAPDGTPTATDAASQFAQVLAQQFGQGNPFGMQSWYGGNPLQTAATMAQRKLDENLAQLRSRYGAQGLGASSRLGLAEGQAIGDTMTGLGDVLAQRGQQAYAQDASRGLEALMGAGQQDLASRQLGLQANQQLMNAGTALTGIGQGEQSIPNLDSLLSYITNMANTNTFGQVAMAGHGK